MNKDEAVRQVLNVSRSGAEVGVRFASIEAAIAFHNWLSRSNNTTTLDSDEDDFRMIDLYEVSDGTVASGGIERC